MHFPNKCIYISWYAAAIIVVLNCKGIEGNALPQVEEGRAINFPTSKLSNCGCVEPSQCKVTPKQTPIMIEQCSRKGGICCFTENIDNSVLSEILFGALPEIIVEEEEHIDECSCLTEEDCIRHDGTVSTFGPNSEGCSDPSSICCLLGVTDTELLEGIFGFGNTDSVDIVEPHFDCRCVPEEFCSHDLASLVNVRSSVDATKICENGRDICCEEHFILQIQPIPEILIEPPSIDSCFCVTKDGCSDEQDLSAVVDLRSRGSVRECEDINKICCSFFKIQNSTNVTRIIGLDNENRHILQVITPVLVEIVHEIECICVSNDHCSENLNSTNESICVDKSKVCCALPKILNTTDTMRDPRIIRNEDCTCMPSSACRQSSNSLSLIADKGIKPCDDPSAVCCFTDDISIDQINPEATHQCHCLAESLCNDTTLLPPAVSVAARCIRTEICCQRPKEFEHRLSCGQSHESNSAVDVRIKLGAVATFAEFPWMVAIFEQFPNGTQIYKCGGSLVHPNVILTTAHCIKDNGNLLLIRAGDWDLLSTSEKRPYEERFVQSRLPNPSFSARSLINNIGLLFVEDPIRLQQHINTICLPESKNFTEYKSTCIASGWGQNDHGTTGQTQSTLKKIILPLMESAKCEQQLRKTRLGPNFQLDSSAICAGGSSHADTCSGDGGSPLICPMTDGSNRFMQVGAVAWGIGCGNPAVPGVYVSTLAMIDWIRKEIIFTYGQEATQYFT